LSSAFLRFARGLGVVAGDGLVVSRGLGGRAAWAINGCASVTGAVLATLLAVHVGFTAVVVVALVLYGVAAAARP
jgi:hypothetical protein